MKKDFLTLGPVIQTEFIPLLFKLCIMIVHTLKMCTADAGQEQNLVLFLH